MILYYPFLSRLWLTLGYLFAKGESLWIFFGFKIGVKEVVVSIYSMLMIPSFSQSLKKSIVCNIKMTITSFKGCRISKSLGKSSMAGIGPANSYTAMLAILLGCQNTKLAYVLFGFVSRRNSKKPYFLRNRSAISLEWKENNGLGDKRKEKIILVLV